MRLYRHCKAQKESMRTEEISVDRRVEKVYFNCEIYFA